MQKASYLGGRGLFGEHALPKKQTLRRCLKNGIARRPEFAGRIMTVGGGPRAEGELPWWARTFWGARPIWMEFAGRTLS